MALTVALLPCSEYVCGEERLKRELCRGWGSPRPPALQRGAGPTPEFPVTEVISLVHHPPGMVTIAFPPFLLSTDSHRASLAHSFPGQVFLFF